MKDLGVVLIVVAVVFTFGLGIFDEVVWTSHKVSSHLSFVWK